MDLKGIFNGTNVSIFSVILVNEIQMGKKFKKIDQIQKYEKIVNIKHKKIANYITDI